MNMDTMLDGVTIDVAHSCKSDLWSSSFNTVFDFTGVKLSDALRHLACAGSSARVKLHTVLRTYKDVDAAKKCGGGTVSVASLLAGTLKADVDRIVDSMSRDKKVELLARLQAELE
jgi:hypothetical protein